MVGGWRVQGVDWYPTLYFFKSFDISMLYN